MNRSYADVLNVYQVREQSKFATVKVSKNFLEQNTNFSFTLVRRLMQSKKKGSFSHRYSVLVVVSLPCVLM